jgi:hypothetical protein
MIEHLAQGARHSRPTRLLPVRQHIEVSPARPNSNVTDPPVYRVQGLVHKQPDAPPTRAQRQSPRGEKKEARATHVKNSQFGGPVAPPFAMRYVGS